MELHKNIFCNTDKLIEGSTITICYTGTLCENIGDGDIYIHYGFGENWENTSEIKMSKTNFGYEANVELIGYDSLNCCFRDGNNNWDNNETKNYCFKIEQPVSEVYETDYSKYQEYQNINYQGNENTALQVVNDSWINRLTSLFKRIASYVPKIVSGTWKRKKTSEN